MSKLLELVKWLPLDDAAAQLSRLLGDSPVRSADILRLGTDGALTLSVEFANGIFALPGPRFLPGDSGFVEWSEDPLAPMPLVRLQDGGVLGRGEQMACLYGVYDLPMIGHEKIDVEDRYQRLANGRPLAPRTELIRGSTWVVDDDGRFWMLFEKWKKPGPAPGSIEAAIAGEERDPRRAEALRIRHRVSRARFLATYATQRVQTFFPPALGLPPDAVVGVRSKALTKLNESLTTVERRDLGLATREEDMLYTLVVGMAAVCYAHDPGAARSDAPGRIAADLKEKGFGVSTDTVRKHLAIGMERLSLAQTRRAKRR